MNNQKGLGFIGLLIVLIIIMLLIAQKTGHLSKWTGKIQGNSKGQSQVGYLEQRTGVKQQVESDLRDIQKMTEKRYQQYK